MTDLKLYILSLFLLACFFNACMDVIMGRNGLAKLGFWFTWKAADVNKHRLEDWLSQFMSEFWASILAKDVLVIFCDAWHFSKFLMVGCFSAAAVIAIGAPLFGLTLWGTFSLLFSFLYYLL